MKCPKCQSDFDDNFKFCPECGSSVSAMSGVEGLEKPGEVGEMSLGELRTEVRGKKSEVREDGQADSLDSRYEIMEEIGRGGFARVWRAMDKKLDRLVAVKRLIEPAVKDHNWEMTVQRFRREARAIAGLNHRNIVGVYDVGVDGEGDYIVMELVEGPTLREYLKEKEKLEETEAVTMVKGIAQGLGYAHKKNLVHRDIKPANVLLLKEGGEWVPKIVDFGLARMGTESELSMTGYGMGTPWYMPPEQRRDAKGVNHTADIYALGKTLYELLTGEVPDQVDPDAVSPGLARVILKCVKNNPEDRYFSAEFMLRDLESQRPDIQGHSQGGTVSEGDAGLICPVCGEENEEGVKFCQNCGKELYARCPECGRESFIGKAFCAECGTAPSDFMELQKIYEEAKSFEANKAWESLLKLRNRVPARDKLKGPKATKHFKQIQALFKAGDTTLKQCYDLNKKVDEDRKRKKYLSALTALQESVERYPAQPDLVKLRKELEPLAEDERKMNVDAEWNQVCKRIENLDAAGDFVLASRELNSFIARTEEKAWKENAQSVLDERWEEAKETCCNSLEGKLTPGQYKEGLREVSELEDAFQKRTTLTGYQTRLNEGVAQELANQLLKALKEDDLVAAELLYNDLKNKKTAGEPSKMALDEYEKKREELELERLKTEKMDKIGGFVGIIVLLIFVGYLIWRFLALKNEYTVTHRYGDWFSGYRTVTETDWGEVWRNFMPLRMLVILGIMVGKGITEWFKKR